MFIVPVVVEMVAFELLGAVIVSALVPPPELSEIAEAPEAVSSPALPNVSEGVLITKFAPPATVTTDVPTLMMPEAFCALRLTVPVAEFTLNVCEINESVPAPFN